MKSCILTATLLALSACANILRSNAPASQVYLLRAINAPVEKSVATPATASLQVALPQAAPGLYSDHIVIVEPGHRMSYYAGSLWAAPLPEILETLVIERLRTTGDWAAVNDSASAFASEYYLQIDIRRFEAEYLSGASPTVRVNLDCAIGRRAGRELLATFSVAGAAPAGVNRVSAVVAAFEQATNASLDQLAERSALAIKSLQVPSPP